MVNDDGYYMVNDGSWVMAIESTTSNSQIAQRYVTTKVPTVDPILSAEWWAGVATKGALSKQRFSWENHGKILPKNVGVHRKIVYKWHHFPFLALIEGNFLIFSSSGGLTASEIDPIIFSNSKLESSYRYPYIWYAIQQI